MSTIKSYADFLQRKTSVKAVVAEFFATAVLCLVGTSTCVWAWELGHARVATMSAGACTPATACDQTLEARQQNTRRKRSACVRPIMLLLPAIRPAQHTAVPP